MGRGDRQEKRAKPNQGGASNNKDMDTTLSDNQILTPATLMETLCNAQASQRLRGAPGINQIQEKLDQLVKKVERH